MRNKPGGLFFIKLNIGNTYKKVANLVKIENKYIFSDFHVANMQVKRTKNVKSIVTRPTKGIMKIDNNKVTIVTIIRSFVYIKQSIKLSQGERNGMTVGQLKIPLSNFFFLFDETFEFIRASQEL